MVFDQYSDQLALEDLIKDWKMNAFPKVNSDFNQPFYVPREPSHQVFDFIDNSLEARSHILILS